MKIIAKLGVAAAISTWILSASPALAQQAPGRAIVSLYRAAPGQQEALIRWLADQDRAVTAAGVAPGQLYVHTDGASWDFMTINPVTTEAQDKAIEEAAKKLGIASGPRASLEFRRHIASHTDTFVQGPMSAAAYVSSLGPAK